MKLPPLSTSPGGGVASLCGLNKLKLSPDGRLLLLHRSNPPGVTANLDQIVIAPTACIFDRDGRCGVTLSGVGPLEFSGWGQDSSSLFLRRQGQLIQLRLSANGRLESQATALMPVAKNVRFLRFGFSQSKTVKEESALIRTVYRKALQGSQGERVMRVEMRPLSGTSWISRNLNSQLTLGSDRASISLSDDLRPQIYGSPLIAEVDDKLTAFVPGWSSHAIRSPYETTVLSPDGQEIGSFAPRSTKIFGGRSWMNRHVEVYLSKNDDVTIDDVAVADSTKLYILTRSSRDATSLVKIGANGTEEISCIKNGKYYHKSDIQWKVETRDVQGRQIAINHFSNDESDQGIVVYYHGGPSRSIRDFGYLETVQRYIDLGYAVLAIDGIGSRDNGVRAMKDLRSNGAEAIRADAVEISQYISRLAPVPKSIIVHGESFGAAQAIATAAQIETRALVLIVPWLKPRRATELFNGPQAQAEIRAQTSWEDAIFGSWDMPSYQSFRSELGSLSHLPSQPPALVIFAAGDHSSRPEDIHSRHARIVVLEDVTHGHVLARAETWQAITDYIAKQYAGPIA